MAHTHSLTQAHAHTCAPRHTHTHTERQRNVDSALCVKSRISWRLFIMHNVPPTIECDRVKLLTQFVRTQAHKSLLRSRSLSLRMSVCVCKPSRRVNCLWGAHYSAVIWQAAKGGRAAAR